MFTFHNIKALLIWLEVLLTNLLTNIIIYCDSEKGRENSRHNEEKLRVSFYTVLKRIIKEKIEILSNIAIYAVLKKSECDTKQKYCHSVPKGV